MPRTKNEFYVPPTEQEWAELAKKVGIKKYSESFAGDLANLADGRGEVLGQEHWIDECRREAVKDVSERNDGWIVEDGYGRRDRFKTRKAALEKATQTLIRDNQRVCDFLKDLDMGAVPGDTPATKALVVLKMVDDSTKNNNNDTAQSEREDPVPLMTSPQAAAKKINEMLDEIKQMDNTERALVGDQSLTGEAMQTMAIADDMAHGADVWMRVARKLDKLHKFKFSKSCKVTPDSTGDEVRVRPIKHMGELNRLTANEWAAPALIRNYRLVTNTAMMRERCIREDKQQLLYIIVDSSGSMKKDDRIYTAGGVVMNRLKAVVNGDAQLYLRFFTNDLQNTVHHAYNPQSAHRTMSAIHKDNFSGGGTSIDTSVKSAMQAIHEIEQEHPELCRPELVIVTDGEDDIDQGMDLGNVRLHAFMVGKTANEHLQALAERSGGVAVQL